MALRPSVDNERPRKIVRKLQRHPFGRQAGSPLPDQWQLGLEEAEQSETADEAEAGAAAPTAGAAYLAKCRADRGSLPAHLPRTEAVVDIADDSCPCCRLSSRPTMRCLFLAARAVTQRFTVERST